MGRMTEIREELNKPEIKSRVINGIKEYQKNKAKMAVNAMLSNNEKDILNNTFEWCFAENILNNLNEKSNFSIPKINFEVEK